MNRILIALVVLGGAVWLASSSASAQQACPPGQTGNFPYCSTVPAECDKATAKLSLLRGTFSARDRTISILAPITRLASGNAQVRLHAAGRFTNFNARVDSANSRIRVIQRIAAAQARLGSGILTLRYPGDADTRSQTVRLRAANNKALLTVTRPTISNTGLLQSRGTVSSRAQGVVRVQLEYVNRDTGRTVTREFKARISDGRWELRTQLTNEVILEIIRRCGTVHSYTLFTGYFPRRIRGEMRSLQVLGKQ